jgi:hypothetical protein
VPACPTALDTTLSKDDGQVTITIRATWDGISAWPDCDGPVIDIAFRNTSPRAWLLQFPSGKAAKTRVLSSGMNRLFSGATLTTLGLVAATDLVGLAMTDMSVDS